MADNPSIVDSLNNIYNSPNATLDEIFADIARQAQKSQELADAAQGTLRGALMQPTPQVPATAESLLAGMGLAAESFTGRKGAFDYGQNLVGRENENLLARRKQSIAELEQSYRQAAQRAEKMQDFEASLKFKVRADRELDRLSKLATSAMTEKEQAFKAGESEKDRSAAMARTALQARTDLARSVIESNTRIGAMKDQLPAVLVAQLSPTLDRMKQISQAVTDVAADPKLNDGQRKKRMEQLNAEYGQLEEGYQAALQAYVSSPAGSSGEAQQTPLGEVLNRARKFGARTFEDFRRMAYSNSSTALLKGYDIKKALEAASIDAPGVGFPKQAVVNKAIARYKELTTGSLKFSKIAQNRAEIDRLSQQLQSWGFSGVPTSDDLLAAPKMDIPGIEVQAPRK